MPKLVAIEGGDGVGKNTIADNLHRIVTENGFRSYRIDFPQYKSTVAGKALGEFLNGRTAELTPRTAAALYALDRFESLQLHRWNELDVDFVIFDRYVASNVAYQSAKVGLTEVDEIRNWIIDLECRVYGLPKPHINVLLDLPYNKAVDLIRRKSARDYTDRTLDVHEADGLLQNSLRDRYADLSKINVLGEWMTVQIVDKSGLRHPDDITNQIYDHLLRHVWK